MFSDAAELSVNPRTSFAIRTTILHVGPDSWPARVFSAAHACVAHNKGFPDYGYMNVTLSLEDELVRTARKIAAERDTTLTALIRGYLRQLAADEAASGRQRRERTALERSFEQFQFPVGERKWKRQDLHERS